VDVWAYKLFHSKKYRKEPCQSKAIKLIPSLLYNANISNHYNWLQSALEFPHLTSDVLIVLDCYVDFSRWGMRELITHLNNNNCPWARYGVITAGHDGNWVIPGTFSRSFMAILTDLAYSGPLMNCASIIRKLVETQYTEPVMMGNLGSGSIILAPLRG